MPSEHCKYSLSIVVAYFMEGLIHPPFSFSVLDKAQSAVCFLWKRIHWGKCLNKHLYSVLFTSCDSKLEYKAAKYGMHLNPCTNKKLTHDI